MIVSNKKSFMEYLVEVDASDLELVRQHDRMEQDRVARSATADKFNNSMKENLPSTGDVISTNKGDFTVVNLDKSGIHLRMLGGDKRTATLPHGTKFKQSGKTPLGKSKYIILK